MSPRIELSGDAISVVARGYRLEVDSHRPVARLTDSDGGSPIRLFLLAALDTDRGLDGTLTHGAARIEEDQEACTLTFMQD
ncbi:MAG TPA: hypothetical protein VHP64_03685, partial [Candidatus Limnocylindria bacterium]|nr:hypothetical protein [Candidatus Limnocylindria bacterium]